MKPISSFVNRILLGDCVAAMGQMPPASVDFIATDPPYLVRYTDRTGRRVANDDRDDWLAPAFAQMYRVLKDNRFLLCFYAWNRVDTFYAAWKASGFRPVGHLVWAKRYASSERYVGYSHESAYLLAKGNPPQPRTILRDVLAWRYTGNTLHPTQKPVMALVPPIQAFTRPGEIVLDPFVGSGTTALAAKSLGRKYIGIDIEPKYAVCAQTRLLRKRAK
jgi:site-specific DNA-methyltransferase (adenine-specific)